MEDWKAIAEIAAGGKTAALYYSPGSKGFSYSSEHRPITASQIAALDGQGVVRWERDDVRQAVLAAGGGNQEGSPASGGDRRQAPASKGLQATLGRPRVAAAVAAAILLLAGGIAAWSIASGTGTSAERESVGAADSVRGYLEAVDSLVESRDATGYAGLVDLPLVGGIMESATVEAYASLPAGTARDGGEEAIRKGYSGYASGVLERIARGDAAGIPLYGIAGGSYAVSGGEVTVTVLPGPAGGEPTTAPAPTGGNVRYVFAVEGADVRLLRIEGIAPYLTPTAVILSGYGQE